MANNPLDTELFDRAAKFAIEAHAGTERRGKGFPYIIHPFEAAEIVATITDDPEILAAAVLHDVVEDCDVSLDVIQDMFGERVALLVASESDSNIPGMPENLSWEERKRIGIEVLRKAHRDAKIVAMGDKLSNARAIWRDYKILGDKLWDRFHAPNGKDDYRWRYLGLVDALSELSDTFAYQEFARLIYEIFI